MQSAVLLLNIKGYLFLRLIATSVGLRDWRSDPLPPLITSEDRSSTVPISTRTSLYRVKGVSVKYLNERLQKISFTQP